VSEQWINTKEAIALGYRWCNVYGCVSCWRGREAAERAGWDFSGENGWPWSYDGPDPAPMIHLGRCPGPHIKAWDVERGKHPESGIRKKDYDPFPAVSA
jgi:hypothetical protein